MKKFTLFFMLIAGFAAVNASGRYKTEAELVSDENNKRTSALDKIRRARENRASVASATVETARAQSPEDLRTNGNGSHVNLTEKSSSVQELRDPATRLEELNNLNSAQQPKKRTSGILSVVQRVMPFVPTFLVAFKAITVRSKNPSLAKQFENLTVLCAGATAIFLAARFKRQQDLQDQASNKQVDA